MGLSFIKPDININFIRIMRAGFIFSAALILAGIISLIIKGGPRLGIDFAGGAMIQVKFSQDVNVDEVRATLSGRDLPAFSVQRFGEAGDNEYLIRISSSNVTEEDFKAPLAEEFAIADLSFSMVGPKVGAELRSNALEALFYAVLLISIYISGRFEHRWMAAGMMAAGLFLGIKAIELAYYWIAGVDLPMSFTILGATLIVLAMSWYLKLNYALGAVVALIHDVLITVGVLSLMNREFDLTIVAALLTIIGYSLNDTIIVFDRIRENIHAKTEETFPMLVNKSINQTLSRTLLTTGTTLFVVVALFFLGGAVIHDFALALLVGIGVGSYSSIFVASVILLGLVPKEEQGLAPAVRKKK